MALSIYKDSAPPELLAGTMPHPLSFWLNAPGPTSSEQLADLCFRFLEFRVSDFSGSVENHGLLDGE
jgi:hypothetical protein